MSTLVDLIDNQRTDKNTGHSYLVVYEKLFSPKKQTARNVLEIGIGWVKDENGGSIKLWRDYFTESMIYGLDITNPDIILDSIKNDERIILFLEKDAYDPKFFKDTFNVFMKNKLYFDILIDDGPHTLESMKTFIKMYSSLLSPTGIMVVEDVQSLDWIPELINAVPNHLKLYVEVYDLRYIKGRWDDILFVINCNK
jgi:hypothetical protein